MSRIQSQYPAKTPSNSRGSGALPWSRVSCGTTSGTHRWLILILVGSFCFSSSGLGQDGTHAGFAFDHHTLTLEPGWRTDAVGPLFYEQEAELAYTWALPPFFSRTDWLDGTGRELDFAYPLLTYDRYGDEYRWQLCQLLSLSGGHSQSDLSRDRFSIFPFYFQQRSAESNQNYTALFPIAGRLQNRIFRTEISFILWPIYVKSVKRPSVAPADDASFTTSLRLWLGSRRGDMTTHNFLWPIFHFRYGDGLFGWQAWPLIGREHKDITTKTNNWGDTVQFPGHDKNFFLWPLFAQQHRELGSANPEHQWMFVPFYNRLRSPLRDSTSYLTPIGLTITDDRARKYHEVGAPWPFIVFTRGEGKTVNRIWPLFSQAHSAELESDFYLWPLYMHKGIKGETLDRHRSRLLFFLGSHISEKNTETGKTKTRTDFWPLFTHRRDFDGRTRLQILALLESLLPTNKSVERDYSPVWTLWLSENNPKTGASSQSFLWNLYRRQVLPAPPKVAPPQPVSSEPKRNMLSLFSPEATSALLKTDAKSELIPSVSVPPVLTRKVSLLFGLFQYESTGENQTWRVFYLPLKKTQKISDHVPEHR